MLSIILSIQGSSKRSSSKPGSPKRVGTDSQDRWRLGAVMSSRKPGVAAVVALRQASSVASKPARSGRSAANASAIGSSTARPRLPPG
jgi:hypothetical protein